MPNRFGKPVVAQKRDWMSRCRSAGAVSICDADAVNMPPMKHSMYRPPQTELPDELVEVIDDGHARFRIERIVSRGHASPADFWYDQDEDEWVWLLSGAAGLEVESPAGESPEGADASVAEIELNPGDYLLLPAHVRHRVSWTSPEADTVWLAVFIRR